MPITDNIGKHFTPHPYPCPSPSSAHPLARPGGWGPGCLRSHCAQVWLRQAALEPPRSGTAAAHSPPPPPGVALESRKAGPFLRK